MRIRRQQLVAMTSKKMFGEDVAGYPLHEYTRLLGERATVQKVNADRKANQEMMMQRVK
jgi:glutathione S-transferase